MGWLEYGRIKMAVQNITDVLQNYTNCQIYHMNLILLLTMVSLNQDISYKFYMALMIHTKGLSFT